MADGIRALLRQTFLTAYPDLKKSLTRRLGSEDAASDVLHDAYLRVECAGEIGAIQNPRGYLFRVAMNTVVDRQRAERARPSASDIAELLNVEDDTPDASRIASSRQGMQALAAALAELPDRCQAIFRAAWVEELTPKELSERFELSDRSIRLELRKAREHCIARIKKKI